MKRKLLNKLLLTAALILGGAILNPAWAETYTELFKIGSSEVVGNSSYATHSKEVDSRSYIITFGGNNKSIGTNEKNRSNCNLSKHSKYAVSPVTTSATASAFACSTSISDVSRISYTFSGGSNQTDTQVYLLYSTDNTTFSQVSLTSGTQGANISDGTAYTFDKKTGYFALLFVATNTSDTWRIDNVFIHFYKEDTPTYAITAKSNNDTYGEVSLSGSVITATPATGYTYAEPAYTVSPDNSAIVAQNGNEFTVTPSANTTVTINFEAIPTYTVTLGDNSSTLTEASGGAGVTLPSRSDVSPYTFAGWCATNITEETTTAPTIIPAGTYNPTANVTLYPVYTRTESGGTTEKTASVSISEYATENSWENSNAYQPLKMDSNISVGGVITGNNFKYYSSDNTWRFYADGSLTVTANNGATLSSVTLTFSAGTLQYNSSNITSETAVSVSGTSAGFECTENAKITAISVSYSIGSSTTYYTTSPVVKEDNSITGVNDEYILDASSGSGYVSLTSVAAAHGSLQSEISSSDIDEESYTWADNVLTITEKAQGIIVIRYYVEADAEYYAVEKLVTVYVRDNPEIAYAGEEETTPYGTPYEVDQELIDGDGAITLTSSNEAVAKVDNENLKITPVSVGSTTITINTEADGIWNAGTATFTLNVTAPAGKTTAYTTKIFEEKFDNCNGTGGNDDKWSGSIASSTLNTDNIGWTFSNGNGASKCARIGSGNQKGSATTPILGATGTLTLFFRAAAWDSSSESTTLNLSVSAGSIDKSSVTLTKGVFNTFTATITNATAATKITFEAKNTSNNRFFLDDVVVSRSPITTTLNASGYATFCSEYPLDFSTATGYTAWQITAVNDEKITFSQITGSIKGGQGILLKGDAGTKVSIPSADSSNELDDNLLEGTTAPTYISAGEYYGLSGNQFVKVSAGTVKAGKALLPASALSNDVKAFTFVFEDDATAIEETLSNSPLKDENIYNLAGQRISKMQNRRPAYVKGINIVNGKKVMVK